MRQTLAFITFLITLICTSESVLAQRYVTTFGVQFKPIVYNSILKTPTLSASNDRLQFDIKPLSGRVFGMVVRRGLSDNWSFESGVNIVRRKYSFDVTALDTNLSFAKDFKLVSYDIPVQMLVYIRLGKQLYINASGGFSMSIFPSDVSIYNEDFEHYTLRRTWMSASLLSNVGFEYRTKKSGYFYLGASYLLPFFKPLASSASNRYPQRDTIAALGPQLNYLTLDIRYFFHENPNEETKKKIREREDKRQKRLEEMGYKPLTPPGKEKKRKKKK